MVLPSSPVYPKAFPLLTRIRYFVKIHFMKLAVSTILRIIQLPGIRDKDLVPTLIKTDQARPSYSVRVFIPKSYKAGDPLLPLYIDVHGGGFTIAAPSGDDKFCAPFAEKNNVLVVAIDYPKAPGYPFPAAVNSLIESVKGVLEDETLPFDKTKVAIGGFSAGANLSLAICQDKALQGKIGGIVAFYPPCDFLPTMSEKVASRPKNAPPDDASPLLVMFDWGYFPKDQDLRDPRISVTYAPREKLPAKICIVGCEYDLLCNEGEIMAQKWGAIGAGERKGNDLVWEQNGIRWEKVLGENHGTHHLGACIRISLKTALAFDIGPAFGDDKPRIEKRAAEMWDAAAQWLSREVYA
jgi:acetyl esterase/lipase